MRLHIIPLLLASTLTLTGTPFASEFLHGADVSFLPQVEAGGGVFRDGGEPAGLFAILGNHGIDTIRLRLWHTPTDGHSGLAETLALAERARDAGCDLLLDLHYSDTWADPGHQTKPAAWSSLSFAELADSVRAYTRDVLTAFANRGVAPGIVKIGNEITAGLLWDDGRVGGLFDSPAQWANLSALLEAARAGLDDALPGAQRPEVMIHIDRGGDNSGARWFLDNLAIEAVEFDLIGLSFYPWWHGTLADLEANLDDLSGRYGKDLVLVETAYPWTLGWFDDTHNLVGLPEQLLPGYPATPEGQRAFLAALVDIVRSVEGTRGRGVFWWAPEWITTPGFGSAWENLALFDDAIDALPALDALSEPIGVDPAPPPTRTGLRFSPNPFSSETMVFLSAPPPGPLLFEVFDVRGRLLARQDSPPGNGAWTWQPRRSAAGTYLFRLTTAGHRWQARATLAR